jgi:hypothetical protein
MDFGTLIVVATTKMDADSPKPPPSRPLQYIRKSIKEMQLRQVMKSYGLHNIIGFV